jgi:hypothetical protein
MGITIRTMSDAQSFLNWTIDIERIHEEMKVRQHQNTTELDFFNWVSNIEYVNQHILLQFH